MRIPVSIRTSYSKADIKALVDSGATDSFIHPNFAKRMGLGLRPLERPKKIWNIDDTTNKSGEITHFVDLDVQTKGIHKEMRFLITDIGKEDILLGYPWLSTYEPGFSWRHATIDEKALPVIIRTVNPTIARYRPVIASGMSEESKQQIITELDEVQQVHQIRNAATEFAIQAHAKEEKKEVVIPPEYQRFAKVFNEEESK
jgi:hypothetical protein